MQHFMWGKISQAESGAISRQGMKMARSTTPLRCIPSPHYLPPKARAVWRACALPSHLRQVSANGFAQGDRILALHPATQLDRKARVHFLHITAAAKGQKPSPKPASSGVVIAAICLPLAMAGTAVLVGRILLERIKKEAREEVEEWERRFNPTRLLPDGLTDEERKLESEKMAGTEDANVPSIRSRPKREE